MIDPASPACRFPLGQVTQRLLQIAAGSWPAGATGAPAAAAANMIDATLAASTDEARGALLPVLQQLLCEASPLVASGVARQLSKAHVAWQTVCTVCQVRTTFCAARGWPCWPTGCTCTCYNDFSM